MVPAPAIKKGSCHIKIYRINPAGMQETLHSLASFCLLSDPEDHRFERVGCGGATSPGSELPKLPNLHAQTWEMKAPGSLLDTTSAPARPMPSLQSKQKERGRHGRARANKFLCSHPPLVMTLWSSHSYSFLFCGITHAAASFWGQFWCQASPVVLLSVTHDQNILLLL